MYVSISIISRGNKYVEIDLRAIQPLKMRINYSKFC